MLDVHVPAPRPSVRGLIVDVDAAVARVRAAGGSAPEPEDQPYGRTALCVDHQGTAFYLGQLV